VSDVLFVLLLFTHSVPAFQPGNSAVVFLKNGRRHHCLSTRFFSEFGNDCQPTSADNTSGGESNEDTDDEVEVTPTPARRSSTVCVFVSSK